MKEKMVLIRINDVNKVVGYHSNPQVLSTIDKEGSIIVECVPEIENKKGKHADLMYNPETNSVYVEYKDRPLTQEEINQEMLDTLNYMVLQNEGLV